jgi:hypothetical protein
MSGAMPNDRMEGSDRFGLRGVKSITQLTSLRSATNSMAVRLLGSSHVDLVALASISRTLCSSIRISLRHMCRGTDVDARREHQWYAVTTHKSPHYGRQKLR